MTKSPKTYTQFFGSERPGVKVKAVTDVKLNNPYLTFFPARDDLMPYTIPKNTEGIIEELHGTTYKLHFSFTDPDTPGIQKKLQAIFSIRLRDFKNFFKKV